MTAAADDDDADADDVAAAAAASSAGCVVGRDQFNCLFEHSVVTTHCLSSTLSLHLLGELRLDD